MLDSFVKPFVILKKKAVFFLFIFLTTMSTPSKLTGVFRSVGGPRKLKTCYNRILQLTDKIPKDAAYRTNVEAIICHRLNILKAAGDDKNEIESGINSGTLETLISQAEAEYMLMQKMILWETWEPLAEGPPPGQWDWPPAKDS